MNKRALGGLGEEIAASFLRLKGYEILDRNIRYARREIDLVARDGGALVAVEVKLRRGARFGSAAEALEPRQLARIRTALEGIVGQSGTTLDPRIDVVALDIDDEMEQMVVRHLVGVG